MTSVYYRVTGSCNLRRLQLCIIVKLSVNAEMAEGGEEGGGGGNASSELVVATIPEDQKHLVCVEYPGEVL